MPTCRGKHLTALTVNKNRRLLSFAQRGDRPHVVVFDLAENKRKKVVKDGELNFNGEVQKVQKQLSPTSSAEMGFIKYFL